jgi:hypothetical protein
MPPEILSPCLEKDLGPGAHPRDLPILALVTTDRKRLAYDVALLVSAFLLTTALILSHNLVTKKVLVTRGYSGFPIDRLELLVMMIDEKSLAAFSPSSYLLFLCMAALGLPRR